MTRDPLAVVRTGSANLASVLAAFERMGVRATLTEDADVVRRAARVVLPGVGAFGAVMRRLSTLGLVDAIAERAAAGEPILAVCLGLQLFAHASDESPGTAGLGIVSGTVRRFSRDTKVPQLGWNAVTPDARAQFLQPGYAYFANSYYLETVDDGWTPAWASYAGRFVAAAERGSQLICQFHPELSGAWGAALLDRWVSRC
ncbi:MAG TPA: imidazole glycerol phosphate synthase subunit HisH [Gemmatimonadales bacterium]|nr:imidazole glycerol phosphate synthase subunit HisH [Gemmatimonadales bacterium]